LILLGVPPLRGLQLHYTASLGFVSDSWAFFVFSMIVVRGGCLVRRRTSQFETRWYQLMSRILLSCL